MILLRMISCDELLERVVFVSVLSFECLYMILYSLFSN